MTNDATTLQTRFRGRRALALTAAGALVGGGLLAAALANADGAAAAEPQAIVYSAFVTDESGDLIALHPPGFEWIGAVEGPDGTVTGVPEEQGQIYIEDPTPGTYTLSSAVNAAMSDASDLVEFTCIRGDINNPDPASWEIVFQSSTHAAQTATINAEQSLTCFEEWRLTEPALGGVAGGLSFSSDPDLIGAESDFVLALLDASGATVGALPDDFAAPLEVPAGTYTPVVVAAVGAQPGFDVDAWDKSSWQCTSPGLEPIIVPYGGSFSVDESERWYCQIQVARGFGDIHISESVEGDVTYTLDGIMGEEGAEFDTIFTVTLPTNAMHPTLPARTVTVSVTLGDNIGARTPFLLGSGWTQTAFDPETGVYEFTSSTPMELGEGRDLRLGTVLLTSAAPSSPIEACASATFPEGTLIDCITVAAVADGCDPDVEDCSPGTPTPTSPTTTTPATTTPATTTPAAEQPGSPTPVSTTPGATTPVADGDRLTPTGGDSLAVIALLGLAPIVIGAVLLAQRRRTSPGGDA